MTHFRQAALVAEWEFTRYFKWRDQLLGLLVFLILGGAGYLAGRLATGTDRMLTVAVEGMDAAALQSGGRLRFVPAPGEPERTAALREGSLRGVLTRRPDGSFALLVETDPPYLGDLSALLDAITRRERLAEHGLGEADLERLLRPTALEIRYVDPERQRAGTGEKLVAGLVAALVILAVFTAMAYLLSGITGEKQLRVTESLISFVTPQAWIDGKILGIGAYALVNILNIVAGGVLMALIARLAWGFDLPNAAVRPATLMLLILFSTLALLLWNSLFAAFAATIDDPNTSARTSVMFVPMLFIGLAGWVVIRDPESPMAQGLALFPLTSPVALPGRAILSDVSFVETALSLVLLLAAIWLARRAAGRIFEIAILMYGKEPGLREMMQWLRVR